MPSPTFKDRLVKAFPVFSKMLDRSKGLVRETVITGGAAGDLTVTGINLGDELVSVMNVTDWTDVTAEFSIKANNTINNTGGTTTATKKVKVLWHPWAQ